MTRQEWLEIGISKGIIEINECEKLTFYEAYLEWFRMKMTFNKRQTMDRIEVTYMKYFKESDLDPKYISDFTDDILILFLVKLCKCNVVTYREMSRIMQILKGVLVYMRDIGKGGSRLHDWESVKRNIPMEKLSTGKKQKYAIRKDDIEKLMHEVIENEIYLEKQSSCLCLCMNFYLGLRVGELAALEFGDFDLERGVVKVWKTESKYYNRDEDGQKVGTMVYRVVDSTKTVYSVREVPILPEARYIYELIRKHHKEMGYNSPYLAYDGKQTVLVRSLDRTLRRLQELLNISKFNTHAIRKTFATALHNANVPTRVISDLLGHSEIGTTENCYILSYEHAYQEYLGYMHDALSFSLK